MNKNYCKIPFASQIAKVHSGAYFLFSRNLIRPGNECVSTFVYMVANLSLHVQVGPIAVTSANPTGEADTTHHNQVYAKLGEKVKLTL